LNTSHYYLCAKDFNSLLPLITHDVLYNWCFKGILNIGNIQ